MKIGRNDPCPCGSGKKYKNCCIDAPSDGLDTALSPIELNRKIAYEGHVGRERKKWCDSFISWKTAELEKITTGQKQLEMTTKNRISCSKGCWFCCSQHVAATLQECDAIVYWLRQHKDKEDAFLARYKDWRNLLRKHENVFQQVNQAGSISLMNPKDARNKELFMEKAEAYGRLNILCPFLEQDFCSIYPVRPFVCASQIVISPPENCNPLSDKKPVVLLGAPSPAPQPPYFWGPKKNLVFSPAPLLVYEIINGGFFYLNDIPGLNGIEDEFFSDPRVCSLFQDTYEQQN